MYINKIDVSVDRDLLVKGKTAETILASTKNETDITDDFFQPIIGTIIELTFESNRFPEQPPSPGTKQK